MGLESLPMDDNEVHGDASLLGREDLFEKKAEQYPETHELTAEEEKKLNEALKKLKKDASFNNLH
ncbi:MAG: hypothetical protein LiPW30_217 [Parcubacteria group bacterium LiPW_30]|nr:MAG: hypothetical protein LiPW30_217 [Parcubacteria group bacterium LiPW_30]